MECAIERAQVKSKPTSMPKFFLDLGWTEPENRADMD